MTTSTISFTPQERAAIREKAARAKSELKNNLRTFSIHPVPLLVAGEVYGGIWLEHNQDNLYIAELHPEAAWASQQVFMDHQREDGLIPFMFPLEPQAPTDAIRYWHLQTVYPFARCALDLAVMLGKPDETLEQIYRAAAKYDRWLTQNRNRAGTGLVEMYCEWDTGHDGSPRVTAGGVPHTCPGQDASAMPDLPMMPILSVDLSAVKYGTRIALAELARRLGKSKDEAAWREKAAETRAAIHKHLYDAEDDFYYDRDRNGFRKFRSEHITRLFLNRVLDQKEFDRIYDRYFASGSEFWSEYPIPSMSVSDPNFVSGCPKNCWGACTQALTNLRALLWLDFYGRKSELRDLLWRCLKAYARPDNNFTQEVNPFDGTAIGTGRNYSPSLILFLRAVEMLKI